MKFPRSVKLMAITLGIQAIGLSAYAATRDSEPATTRTDPAQNQSPATREVTQPRDTTIKPQNKKGPALLLKKFDVSTDNQILRDKDGAVLPKESSTGHQKYTNKGVVSDFRACREGEAPPLNFTMKIDCGPSNTWSQSKQWSFPASNQQSDCKRVDIGPQYPIKSGTYPWTCTVSVAVSAAQAGWHNSQSAKSASDPLIVE